MSLALGKNLKAYREASGYTQAKFSRLCKISRQSLHKHESGRVLPTEENIANYAKILGISASKLKNDIHPSNWKFKVFDRLTWGSSSENSGDASVCKLRS